VTFNEAITLAAILAGPIMAVGVQLVAERRKQRRDQQTATMRLLASTRHLPSDPGYSTAINLIPIDFNKVTGVIQAHKNYIEAISHISNEENRAKHDERILTQQTKLIFSMAKHLGLDLPETDIQTAAYAAGGFIQRDNLFLNAWAAWPRIALALEKQTDWISSQKAEDRG
jgi:hypothetical protein